MYHANSLPCKNGWIARGVLNIKRSAKDEICLYMVIFDINQNTSWKKKLIKHVVFSALSKNVSPSLFNDNPQVPSGGSSWKSDTSFIETKSDALLWYKQIFKQLYVLWNILIAKFQFYGEKKGEKYCIFRPELPPLVLNAGLHQKPNKYHSK